MYTSWKQLGAKYIMENGWIKDKCVLFGLETVRLPDMIIRLL